MAGEFTAAQVRGERRHCVQHPVGIGYDVGAIDHDAGAAPRAQGNMQNGSAFRGIDHLAGEQRAQMHVPDLCVMRGQRPPGR